MVLIRCMKNGYIPSTMSTCMTLTSLMSIGLTLSGIAFKHTTPPSSITDGESLKRLKPVFFPTTLLRFHAGRSCMETLFMTGSTLVRKNAMLIYTVMRWTITLTLMSTSTVVLEMAHGGIHQ